MARAPPGVCGPRSIAADRRGFDRHPWPTRMDICRTGERPNVHTRAVYAARTMTEPIGQQAQDAWLASLFDITG